MLWYVGTHIHCRIARIMYRASCFLAFACGVLWITVPWQGLKIVQGVCGGKPSLSTVDCFRFVFFHEAQLSTGTPAPVTAFTAMHSGLPMLRVVRVVEANFFHILHKVSGWQTNSDPLLPFCSKEETRDSF